MMIVRVAKTCLPEQLSFPKGGLSVPVPGHCLFFF